MEPVITLRQHGENFLGRDYFVGDLHGQHGLLEDALRAVDFDGRVDRLFSVGDLIDRGPDSLACLALTQTPWFFAVRGNHEMLAWEALFGDGSGMALWMLNGGGWVHGERRAEVQRRLRQALGRLPHAREIAVGERRIGLVHAEPPADWRDIEATDAHHLLWSRDRIRRGDRTLVAGIDAVVVGHTVVEAPLTLGNVHYIDTGACHRGRLTLIEARALLAS